MIKILGAVLVFLGSALGGLRGRQAMRQRLETRRELESALERLQGEMELTMPPVGSLFETVGRGLRGPVGEVFTRAGLEMTLVTGRPPATALRIALEDSALDGEAKGLLMEVGTCLGRYDLSGQARALERYRRRAQILSSEARQQLKSRARASMTASLCGGLALIIILL